MPKLIDLIEECLRETNPTRKRHLASRILVIDTALRSYLGMSLYEKVKRKCRALQLIDKVREVLKT